MPELRYCGGGAMFFAESKRETEGDVWCGCGVWHLWARVALIGTRPGLRTRFGLMCFGLCMYARL